eukprot:Hpha_TRINITY_DN26685_c0_g1::TRINITY_DN26685_c0_g1_i1::g.86105::m.86105
MLRAAPRARWLRLCRPISSPAGGSVAPSQSEPPPSFTWNRPGRTPVVVADPDGAARKALQRFRVREVAVQLAEAEQAVELIEQRVEPLRLDKATLDKQADAFPDSVMRCVFLGLVVLWFVMFWMVFAGMLFGPRTFFAFDWNTVEPITYFVLYAAVWFACVFYYFAGVRFSYSELSRRLAGWRRARLYESHRRFDPTVYKALSADLAAAQERVRELHGVRGL